MLRSLRKASLVLSALVLTLSSPGGAHSGNSTLEREAFKDACRLTSTSCEGLEVPIVLYESLIEDFGFAGTYQPWYGPVVWLDHIYSDALRGPSWGLHAYGIVVHEMVHYIDLTVNGYSPWTAERACASEGMAYNAANTLMIEQGHPELASWNWREYYDHCP